MRAQECAKTACKSQNQKGKSGFLRNRSARGVCAPLCARQRARCARHIAGQTRPMSGSWTMITGRGGDRLAGAQPPGRASALARRPALCLDCAQARGMEASGRAGWRTYGRPAVKQPDRPAGGAMCVEDVCSRRRPPFTHAMLSIGGAYAGIRAFWPGICAAAVRNGRPDVRSGVRRQHPATATSRNVRSQCAHPPSPSHSRT